MEIPLIIASIAHYFRPLRMELNWTNDIIITFSLTYINIYILCIYVYWCSTLEEYNDKTQEKLNSVND